MGIKRHKSEEIISKLRQLDALVGQGMSRPDAIRQVLITEQTYYRWGKQYGGMGTDQLRELKKLQKENEQLLRAVADLTLDKQILAEAARGNQSVPHVADDALIRGATCWVFLNAGPVECLVSSAPLNDMCRGADKMKIVCCRYDRAGSSVWPLRLRGVPGYIQSDNDPEFVAEAVRKWIAAVAAQTAYIEPGSPWENG